MPEKATRHLGEETWGDRMNRAFRQARRDAGGPSALNYRLVVERLTDLFPMLAPLGDSQILRLELLDNGPQTTRQKILAYLTLRIYGYDPADFGLTEETVPLQGFDRKKLNELGKPLSRCSPLFAA